MNHYPRPWSDPPPAGKSFWEVMTFIAMVMLLLMGFYAWVLMLAVGSIASVYDFPTMGYADCLAPALLFVGLTGRSTAGKTK